jgi:hypothetical protein
MTGRALGGGGARTARWKQPPGGSAAARAAPTCPRQVAPPPSAQGPRPAGPDPCHGTTTSQQRQREAAAAVPTPSRRRVLQRLAAAARAAALAGALQLGRPQGSDALTVADVTPLVAAAPPLPAREQAIVDGGRCRPRGGWGPVRGLAVGEGLGWAAHRATSCSSHAV